MENDIYKQTVRKVGITTIIMNFLLTAAKIVGGILAKSSSLVSDGVHSASDVLSTIVVMIGARLSRAQADDDHPFGHERLESIASILLAVLLGITAIFLGYNGVLDIITFSKGDVEAITGPMIYLALSFAVASILIKGWMYFYTMNAAKKINSTGLKADAFHHLTDSLSSIASVFGIIGLMIGGYWGIADPVASIIIAIFIIKVAVDIMKEAISQVVDHAAPQEFQDDVKQIASNTNGVIAINSLRTRIFGNMYYVELEIAVDDNLTVLEGHNIAQEIHDKVEHKYQNIKHCMIHVDPISESK